MGKSVSIQTVEADAASGALPLRGLTVSPDDRLFSVTLTGEPNLVAIAEGYLKQIDLRKRQVAIRLQILDVDLLNRNETDNSFALRTGNAFIVNKNGELLANFGGLKPPSDPDAGLPSNYNGSAGSPLVGSGAFQLPGGAQEFVDQPVRQYPFEGAGTRYPFGTDARLNDLKGDFYVRPGYGPYSSPGQPGISEVEINTQNVGGHYSIKQKNRAIARFLFMFNMVMNYISNAFFTSPFINRLIGSSSASLTATRNPTDSFPSMIR